MKIKVHRRPNVQRLLALPNWPAAVHPALVVNPDSEEEKRLRAYCQLARVEWPPRAVFLDFGCGEGHTVHEAELLGVLTASGYDPAVPRFAELDGHFNVILMHDVLDHCGGADEAVAALEKARRHLSPGGRVYVRCHPWTSPHGGHLYRTANRSHLHLLVDEKHLPVPLHFGPPDMDDEYRRWFARAGLSVVGHSSVTVPPPLMLPRPVAEAIFDRWGLGPEHVLGPLSTEFIDYVLGE